MVDTAPNVPINPYISLLEHKPKPVLSHEIGAGSPCLKCDCPGLDLHFWRKICKVCFCRMDEHDVVLPDSQDRGELIVRKLFDTSALKDRIASVYNADSYIAESLKTPPFTQKNNGGPHYDAYASIDDVLPLRHFHIESTETSDSTSVSVASSVEREHNVSEYTWVPSANPALIGKYMESLPVSERPIIGTDGAQLRRQRLAYQMPYHDCDFSAAKSVSTPEERARQEDFVSGIKQKVVGIGEVVECDRANLARRSFGIQTEDGALRMPDRIACTNCEGSMNHSDVGVITEHGRSDELFHPGCFKCATCQQLLADLLYFFKDGQYYCGRHYGEKVYPRCSGCDELIFAREYTFAEDKSWHVDHFCCFGCDRHLCGLEYVSRDDRPFCLSCFMDRFAKTCTGCQRKIKPSENRITHKDLHWHADGTCFKYAHQEQHHVAPD
ncbi:PET domain-containing protein [Aphelenchoides avenae]|nr:PET domain-containing protein [Aphelenchus avenae]